MQLSANTIASIDWRYTNRAIANRFGVSQPTIRVLRHKLHKPRATIGWNKEARQKRSQRIMNLRASGLAWSAVALVIGVSRQRAQQLANPECYSAYRQERYRVRRLRQQLVPKILGAPWIRLST